MTRRERAGVGLENPDPAFGAAVPIAQFCVKGRLSSRANRELRLAEVAPISRDLGPDVAIEVRRIETLDRFDRGLPPRGVLSRTARRRYRKAKRLPRR